MSSLVNAVCLVAFLSPVSADLPVHCLKPQVEGDWDFYLGEPSNKRSSCGHRHPDTEDEQPGREIISLINGGKSSKVQRVSLAAAGDVALRGSERGSWTMIYDEGFEVNFASTNFMAFSNFTLSKTALGSKTNVSHCGETMVGWYRNADRTEFGCYYGVKVNKTDPAPPAPLPATGTDSPVKQETTLLTKADVRKKVAKLNKKLSMMQVGWNARSMEKWYGKTMEEINSYAGLRRTTTLNQRKELMKQHTTGKKVRSFLQQRATKLPDTFDWSNASGVDWLEPVMDQSSCGSCYAASTMRMISTRHKISQKNETAIPFSINMPLHCGEYNQGCNGGYGSLISKWGEDVGLLPATCMRYNTEGTCKLECDLKKLEGKRWRVANHRLIGNWYGNSSVAAMKEEIYHNGPIVVSFEPSEDFMFYSDGIYTFLGDSAPSNATHSTLQTAESRATNPWVKVDHAVLAVGWGEDAGQKYWRIQNSWGPDWGEDGFFRIQLGTDDSGVESIPEAADVVEDEQNGRRVEEFFDQLNARW